MLVNVLTLCVMLWALPASAYLTDLGTHTEPAAPSLPTAGSTAVDPTFGSTIMRLTDSGDSATHCMTIYSANPSFNVNSTKVGALCSISGAWRFKVWDFNATTMTRSNGRIQANSIVRTSNVQWSRTTYNKFYSCSGSTLYEVTIPDGTSTTWTNTPVRNFAAEIGSGTECLQGSLSSNDDVFAFHYAGGYLAWKRSTNTVLLQVANPSVNEVEIDKSGRYLIYCCDPPVVWDLQATPSPTSTTITNQPFNHRGMGSGFSVSRGSSGSSFYKHPMATPNSPVTLLPGLLVGTVGEHYSAHGPDTWALSCRYRKNAEASSVPFDNECFLFNTTTPNTVKRLVHHRANVYGDDYNSQPHGNLSMDGQFIAWTSNWDGASTTTRRDVYIARTNDRGDLIPPAAPTKLTVR